MKARDVMKKYQIPVYLANALDDQGTFIFLQAANAAEQKGYSVARCLLAGIVALQDAGYAKDPSGKWKLQPTVTIKMEKASDDICELDERSFSP